MENQNSKQKSCVQKVSGLNGLKALALGVGFVGVIITAYLSFRADPALSTVGWLPQGLAHWADAHPRFDNFPAFGLAALLFFAVASRPFQFLAVLGGFGFLILGLELTQLLIASRHCDPWDMFWGCAGVLAAGVAVCGIKFLGRLKFAGPMLKEAE